MSVFVSTTYYGDESKIQDAIDELHQLGINHIELGSNHAPCDVQTLRLYPNTRYIIHNYFPAQDPNFVLNLVAENKEIREKSINFIKNTIKICQKFGIKFYTIHPGFLGEASIAKSRGVRNFDFQFQKNITLQNRPKVINRTIKIIESLYKYAKDYNVQLLVENEGSKTSGEFTLFDSIEELDLLKKEVGGNLKFNFNLAHAVLAGIRLKDPKVFSHFYDNTQFFEVSEIAGDLDSHLPIRHQEGNIASLVKKYSKYFTKKNIILEYRNVNIKEVKKSYDFVKKLISA